MSEVKYFQFKRNGEVEKGGYWTNAPVKHMRNAYFKRNQSEHSKLLSGVLYYQTAFSDEWCEKIIKSINGKPLYRKIITSFEECTEQDFITYTSQGSDLYAYKIKLREVEKELEKKKAESIEYVGNQFAYSSHDKMMRSEKENYFLRNPISEFTKMRSFLLEIEAETPTMFKTKIIYIEPGASSWKIRNKNFSKKKIQSAYGSGLIKEIPEEVLAKYYLLTE